MASKRREQLAPPRQLLVSWLARLYRHGLTTTTGGNLSMIDDDGTLYITPSGGDKAIIPPERIAARKAGQTNFEGPSPPSMEWPLHAAAYDARGPNCRAVLHAHSMTLIAFSLARNSLNSGTTTTDPRLPDTRVLLGAYQTCGKVAFTPYYLPGTQDLADGCRKAFKTGADCVILQNHGVMVAGENLNQAYDCFVSLEYLARSIVNAVPLGVPPKPLSTTILKYSLDLDNKSKENPFPKRVSIAPSTTCNKQRIICGDEKEARENLCRFVHRAYDQSLVTSSSGSFSARLKQNTPRRSSEDYFRSSDEEDGLAFIITPTNVDRRSLEATDLCYLSYSPDRHSIDNEDNQHNDGDWLYHPLRNDTTNSPTNSSFLTTNGINTAAGGVVSPSRASAVHGTIYKMHPEINCIMVVQPSFATAYCITGQSFNSAGIPESRIVLHNVQTLPIEAVLEDNGRALSAALDFAAGKTTVLVEGYGLISVGVELLETFIQIEVCESMCGAMLTALRRGPVALLNQQEVDDVDVALKYYH